MCATEPFSKSQGLNGTQVARTHFEQTAGKIIYISAASHQFKKSEKSAHTSGFPNIFVRGEAVKCEQALISFLFDSMEREHHRPIGDCIIMTLSTEN